MEKQEQDETTKITWHVKIKQKISDLCAKAAEEMKKELEELGKAKVKKDAHDKKKRKQSSSSESEEKRRPKRKSDKNKKRKKTVL